jgi:quercetin dioxygenase-like cupin family protein
MKVGRWGRGERPDERVLRAQPEAEGYAVYAWTDHPGTTYESHTHDDAQGHGVVRGAMALTVGGEEYVLRAGDRDWLPAGTVRSVRVIGEEAVTYLVGSKRAPSDWAADRGGYVGQFQGHQNSSVSVTVGEEADV